MRTCYSVLLARLRSWAPIFNCHVTLNMLLSKYQFPYLENITFLGIRRIKWENISKIITFWTITGGILTPAPKMHRWGTWVAKPVKNLTRFWAQVVTQPRDLRIQRSNPGWSLTAGSVLSTESAWLFPHPLSHPRFFPWLLLSLSQIHTDIHKTFKNMYL